MNKSLSIKNILSVNDLSLNDIDLIVERSNYYAKNKGKFKQKFNKMKGMTVANVFFENSTRTRASFEIASKKLGADNIFFSTTGSSIQKGETLLDTIKTLEAMQTDIFVIRHSENFTPHEISKTIDCPIINAGDGTNEHPTQALLDLVTIKKKIPNINGLKIAICGDIFHSRVANSNIKLLNRLGANINIIAPEELLPKNIIENNYTAYDNLEEGIKDCDIVMMLRIQHERIAKKTKINLEDYIKTFKLDHTKLLNAKKEVFVMHPGPINREVEISSKLADDKNKSIMLLQVELGIPTRMACLDLITCNN